MMERRQIVEAITVQVRKVLSETQGQQIGDNRDLREFASFDSVAIIEMLVWLEEKFDITISDEDLIVDRFTSVGDMADYVIVRSK